MSELIGIAIVSIGVIFNIIGCIGLIRLPDIYNRLQAATKCVTRGTCLLLVGCMILSSSTAGALKCMLCGIFIIVTSPTAAHALARGAHTFGIKLSDVSITDDYARDKKSGKEVEKKS